MHGLTGGSWKRNKERTRATEMKDTRGKPCGHQRLRDLPLMLVTAPALDPTKLLTGLRYVPRVIVTDKLASYRARRRAGPGPRSTTPPYPCGDPSSVSVATCPNMPGHYPGRPTARSPAPG